MKRDRRSTEQPTQRIPAETLAEVAAYHRAQLEQRGLVEPDANARRSA